MDSTDQAMSMMGIHHFRLRLPQDFVDDVSQSFRTLLDVMNISNDDFIRTTDENHKKSVQHLWNKAPVDSKGAIYLGSYEGWYSVRDECYHTESELVDGKVPTGSEVIWQAKEPSNFFKLSAFEDQLLEYYERNADFIAPAVSRRNEVLGFFKGGLRDMSISRTSFKWGVPAAVPDDDDHVMYVWIDALALCELYIRDWVSSQRRELQKILAC